MRILIVEDDPSMAAFLAEMVQSQRYVADIAVDGQAGLDLALTWEYDLILLDYIVPSVDGVSICQQLRQREIETPILLLTAKTDSQHIVTGLDAGADDYVTKPFDPVTLMARIRALLRRGSGQTAAPLLCWGKLSLNPSLNQVFYDTDPIPLTPREYMLLELFLRQPHRVFSRSAIIDRLWDLEMTPSENAVTNLIKDLRQKLRKAGLEDAIIETVYGVGYRLKEAPSKTIPTVETAPVPTLDTTQETVQTDVMQAPADQAEAAHPAEDSSGVPLSVLKVIDRFRGNLLRQAEALIIHLHLPLDDLQSIRLEVEQQAHKLAGSLDTFGYQGASEVARALEHVLGQTASLTLDDQQHLQQQGAALQEILQTSWGSGQTPFLSSQGQQKDLPQILLIEGNEDLSKRLALEATHLPLTFHPVRDVATAQIWLQQHQPAVVLLDLSVQSDGEEAGLAVLPQLVQQFPDCPILVLSETDTLDHRIRVSRLGGRAYLHKQLPAAEILRSALQAVPQPRPDKGAVLVVDDDPVALAILQKVLQPLGVRVKGLQDPAQFWTVLKTIQPQLVILDLEMPTFDGVDLCQVVRQDPIWRQLPILVITAHTDVVSLDRVFAAGANECLSKPIIAADIVTRVTHYIERGYRPTTISGIQTEKKLSSQE